MADMYKGITPLGGAWGTIGGSKPMSGSYGYIAPKAKTGWGSTGSGSTNSYTNIGTLIKKLEQQAASARTANLSRYNEAMGIYEKIESMYSPGGTFETSAYDQLDRMKKQDLAHATQTAVDAGLSKTTGQQYASQRWTEEVGAPAIQQIQAQAQGLMAQAMGNRAAFIERREDVGPDYATIAQLVMAANS